MGLSVVEEVKSVHPQISTNDKTDEGERISNEQDEGPEEGEIIDVFEDIVSSDEEISMRWRIKELEARNSELEKIAKISGAYETVGYDYLRHDIPHISHEPLSLIALDLSEDDDYTRPLRRRRHEECSPRHKRSHYRNHRRKQSSSTPPPPPYRPEHNLLISMIRDHRNVTSSRKRKRKSKKSYSPRPSHRARNSHQDDFYCESNLKHHSDSHESIHSVEGARVSHTIKDHPNMQIGNTVRSESRNSTEIIQKKSDDDELENRPKSEHETEIPKKEEVDLEEQELRIIALKSAVLRKHMVRKKRNENLAYSPSDFDAIFANITISPPIPSIDDSDAIMEISPVPSPKDCSSDNDMKPVDMDIANSDSENDFPIYERWVPIDPVPIGDSNPADREIFAPTAIRCGRSDEVRQIIPETKVDMSSPGCFASEVEDEEQALRTLLLSKMNSPRSVKSTKEQTPNVAPASTSELDVSMEAENLRDFLLRSMKQRQEKKSTDGVLKQAVNRLTAMKALPDTIKSKAKENLLIDVIPPETKSPAGGLQQCDAHTDSVPEVAAHGQLLRLSEAAEIQTHILPSNETIKTEKRDVKADVQITQTAQIQCGIMTKLENSSKSEEENKLYENPKAQPPVLKSSVESKKQVLKEPMKINAQRQAESSQDCLKKVKREPLSPILPPKDTQLTLISKVNDRTSIKRPYQIINKKVPENTPRTISFSSSSTNHVSNFKSTLQTHLPSKIVKPNKVINKQTITLKRKVFTTETPIVAKQVKVEDPSKRIITTIDMPTVKKLVIQVGPSDSESEYSALSEDNYANDDTEVCEFKNIRTKTFTAGGDGYAVESDSKSCTNSPCNEPTGPEMPVDEVNKELKPTNENSIVDEFFEARLDKFLKTIRAQVTADQKSQAAAKAEVSIDPTVKTPVVVRHLPEASRQEYVRLVNRMKMLERRKQVVKNKTEQLPLLNKTPNKTRTKKTPTKTPIVGTIELENKDSNLVDAPSIEEKSIPIVDPPKMKTNKCKKRTKEELLVTYEKFYKRTCDNILSNLDKSLGLVATAREFKKSKLRYELRLTELRNELERVQRNLDQQHERIMKIYPQVQSSHQTVSSLKAKQSKISNAMLTLGKSLNGDDYMIPDDQKSKIMEKTKILASQIKFVNNMKYSDLDNSKDHVVAPTMSSVRNNTENVEIKELNEVPKVQSDIPSNDALLSVTKVPGNDVQNLNEPPADALVETGNAIESNSDDTAVPDSVTYDDDNAKDTHGHEEALETDVIREENNQVDPVKIEVTINQEAQKNLVGGAHFQDYISPLGGLLVEREINPNGIVCPYQLMGQCDDKDCKYMHLDN